MGLAPSSCKLSLYFCNSNKMKMFEIFVAKYGFYDTRFFMWEKFVRNEALKAKIMRKFQISSLVLLAKYRYYLIHTFKMLRMEYKLEFGKLTNTDTPVSASLF